jgi:endonuclease YncB( thermonuclease family)
MRSSTLQQLSVSDLNRVQIATFGCAGLARVAAGDIRAKPKTRQFWLGKVTRVVDGDTIEVKLASGDITVRLHGIDTPERGQPWFEGARQREAPTSISLAGQRRTAVRWRHARKRASTLANCGLTRMDGDGDGVPCETLCK